MALIFFTKPHTMEPKLECSTPLVAKIFLPWSNFPSIFLFKTVPSRGTHLLLAALNELLVTEDETKSYFSQMAQKNAFGVGRNTLENKLAPLIFPCFGHGPTWPQGASAPDCRGFWLVQKTCDLHCLSDTVTVLSLQDYSCVSATCGHFYHPHCVTKLLHRDEAVAEELEKKIAAGDSFTCPIHK
ncbi:hypothetical protein LguiB_023643 [Lonicera macranthoides]